MAINFTDFSRAPIQDSPLKSIFEDAFKGYQMGRAPKQMDEELKAKQLANQLLQMDIGHKPKEFELTDQGKTLANALHQKALDTYDERFKMDKDAKEAQIGSAKAAASKAQTLQQILANVLKGNSGSTGGQSGGEPGMDNQEPTSNQLNNLNQTGYAQAAIASKAMGIEPKIVDINGVQTAITPFGNYPVAKGLTPLQKELTKQDAKTISELENTARAGIASNPTMEELSRITSSPVFESMRQNSLVPGYEMAYYLKRGTPEQKEMAGNFMTLTNQLIKDSARDFSGQFRIGEQEMLERMKLSPKDTLDVARGKLESLMLMKDLMTQRSSIAAGLAREQGISPLKAVEIADKQLDLNKMRDQIRQKVGLKKALPEGMRKKGYTMDDIEHTAAKRHMTVDEVISQWENANA